MTQDTGTLELLARRLASALAPLSNAFDSPEALQAFLEELGWQVPSTLSAIGLDPGRVDAVLEAFEEVAVLDLDTADRGEIASKYGTLLAAVAALAQHIYEVRDRISSHLDAAYLAASNMAEELPKRLLDYLIAEHLVGTQPPLFYALQVLGFVELQEIPQDDTTFTSEHTRRTIHYNRLATAITDPTALFRDVYGWGTPTADLTLLIERLYDLALVLGLPAALEYPVYEKEANLSAPVAVPLEGEAENLELRIPIIGTEEETSTAEVGVTLMPLPPLDPAGSPALALCPYASGVLSEAVPLDNEARWIVTITGALDLVVGIGLIFRPEQALSVLTDILGSTTNASGFLTVDLRRQALPNERIVILGAASGTGLTATTLYGKVGLVVGTGQETDFLVELAVEGGRLRLAFDSIDSFLASLLPRDPLDLLFDLGVGWSSQRGIYFTGGAGLEYSRAIHETIGPLRLEIIHFGFKFKDSSIRLFMAITGGGQLGPLAASVESVGLELVLSFPNQGGNLGPANLVPTFKPPNGVGLLVDAGVVKGGGYLYFDFEKEEYAGALELVFSGFLILKAIGLITTRMPDGSKGFSLLIIITAEFGTGIQLGFGFTLLGVGGLLGLNRTMKLQPLVDGVRTGTVNNILFPRDVIANAPRIISDLRTIFPPEEGKFLIGPMAKLGWGTPTLVSLSLGIIIEIPGNIAILGVLRVALPSDDAALLILQVSFVGAIEFDKKRIYFFASLFESRVLFMTIEGEMGLLVAFGDDANFVVSVGGFHPRFNPPPLPFPNPIRVAVNILNESYARIRVMGYFAVTSNTAQFGARAELFFGFSAFSVEGFIGFDALFQFSPFYFIIEISAAVSLKAFGVGLFSIRLRLSLEGPTPWRAKGTGSISFLFFEISADFDVTWGESRDTTLPPIEVMPLLKAEFEKLENWRALLPAANNLLVSLRKLDPVADLVLHPVGTLRITQKAIPLNIPIDKVGSQKPSDAKRLSVTVSGGGLSRKSDATELFAIAQFQNLDDAKKLSAPGYEPEPAGLELSVVGAELKSSKMVKRIVRYEEIIIDSNYKRFVHPFFLFVGVLFGHFLRGNSISKSVLSQAYQTQLQPFAEKIAVHPENYAVAFQATNQMFTTRATFVSEAMARDFMQQQVAQNPDLLDTLHVIPQHEVAV